MAHRRSLGFPGFPVESCDFGQLHVVLFKREPHPWSRVRAAKQEIQARDDKKERAVVRKGRLLDERVFSNRQASRD